MKKKYRSGENRTVVFVWQGGKNKVGRKAMSNRIFQWEGPYDICECEA